MAAYIKVLAEELSALLDPFNIDSSIQSRFVTLAEEVDRLDPRDFIPSARVSFVHIRRRARQWALVSQDRWREIADLGTRQYQGPPPRDWIQVADLAEVPLDRRSDFEQQAVTPAFAVMELLRLANKVCNDLVTVLDSYGGPDSGAVSRSFAWVKNKALRQIVERDYRELTLILFPAGAWKSTVVLAGSILEAILYDLLTRGPARVKKAMVAAAAPRKLKGTAVRDIRKNTNEDEWRLENLIDVAAELGLIEKEEKDLTHQALRKYRNFIHPHREKSEEKALSEGEATAALGALKVICDHLEKGS
jgi:hypothetical protein